MIDLSIIIINYNTNIMTQNTIKSIISNTKLLNYEIIIVDNSDIKNKKYLNNLNIECIKIINTENKGFSSACNQGAQIANGQFLLFMNSDIIVNGNALNISVNYIKKYKDIGILGCKILLEDKSLDHGCKRGFPTPKSSLYYFLKLDKKYPNSKKYGAYRLTYMNDDDINEVDAVSGAFLMIQKKLFDDINGFDETFFMYGEDLDLCYRVKEKGYKIIYYPKAVITHLKGQSGLQIKNQFVLYHFYKSMVIFYNKHYRKKYNFFVTWLIYFSIWGQYIINFLKAKLKVKK